MNKDTGASWLFENFLFPHLFRAFRMAIHPRKLIIVFMGVSLIAGLAWLIDQFPTVLQDEAGRTEVQIYVQNPELLKEFITANEQCERKGIAQCLGDFQANCFLRLLNSVVRFDLDGTLSALTESAKGIEWAVRYHWVFSGLIFGLTLAVSSVVGAAVCRIAVLEFAQGEHPGLMASLRYGWINAGRFFAAPLLPLGILAFFGAFIAILGLMGNIPWAGELLVGLGMPLVLVAGIVMGFIIMGQIAGLGLMFPSVAYENGECFVAINNSFRFVFARPWRLGFYGAIAVVYGAVTYFFVRFFAFAVLWVIYRFLQLGFLKDNDKLAMLWPEPAFNWLLGSGTLQPELWTQHVSIILIRLAVLSVVGVVVAYAISYYFCVNTIIYALMRKRVDGVEIDHIPPKEDDLINCQEQTHQAPEKVGDPEPLPSDDQ